MNTRFTSSILVAAALSVSTFVPLSASSQAPQPVSRPLPVYAYDLLWSHIEGEVLVNFTITPNGDVADAVVTRSSHKTFDRDTLKAIRQWKFIPAMKDGVAVSTPAIQVVKFTIQRDVPEPATNRVAGKPKPSPSVRKTASTE